MIQTKPYTIDELVTMIFEDNLSHFNKYPIVEDCKCHIHTTMNTILHYWEQDYVD